MRFLLPAPLRGAAVSCRVPLAIRLVVCSLGLALGGPAAAADPPPQAKPAQAVPAAGPIEVKLVRDDQGYRLLRGGKPYFIQGAGGDGPLDLLARSGANSIRTWGAEHLDRTLDEAHKHGLSVAVGIWLGHERHGFNYNDADQVAAQAEMVRGVIERYKSHPAVLLWGLGNEMEGYAAGDNAAIWSAINNLAVMAKKLDPKHPTMTVVAEIGGDRVKNVEPPVPRSGHPGHQLLRRHRLIGAPLPRGGGHQTLLGHRIRTARGLGGRQKPLGRGPRIDQHRKSRAISRRLASHSRGSAAGARRIRLHLG